MNKAQQDYADRIRRALRHDRHAMNAANRSGVIAQLITSAVNLDRSISRIIGKKHGDLFAHAGGEQIIETQAAANYLREKRAMAEEEMRIILRRPNNDDDNHPGHVSRADSARKSEQNTQSKVERLITENCADPSLAFKTTQSALDNLRDGHRAEMPLSAFVPSDEALEKAKSKSLNAARITEKSMAVNITGKVSKWVGEIHHSREIEEAQNTSRAEGRAIRKALQVVDGRFSEEVPTSRSAEIRRQADEALSGRQLDAKAQARREEVRRNLAEGRMPSYQPPQMEWSRGNGNLGLKRTGTDRER